MSVFSMFLFFFFSKPPLSFKVLEPHTLSKECWQLPNHSYPQKPLRNCFPVSHIREKAVKTVASEWEVRNPRQTAQIVNSSVVSTRGEGRTGQFLISDASEPMKLRCWIQVQGGLWSQAPGDVHTARPWALAPGLVLFTCHLSPFINNHLPQKWRISKAIPISLLFRPAQPLGQGAIEW